MKDEEYFDLSPSIGSKVNENSQCRSFFIKSNVEKKCQDDEDSSRMQEGVETQVEKEETNKKPVLFAKNHSLQECDVLPGWITSGSRWVDLEDEESLDVSPSIGSKDNENSQCRSFFKKSKVRKKWHVDEDSSKMQEGVEREVEKEETNKLPMLFAKNHKLQECDVSPGWDIRKNPGSKNCNRCGRFALFAHAMIQCTKQGNIPLGNFSPKIQKARTAVAQVYLDPHIEYENVLCENVGTLGLRDQIYNYCFECYGSDFKGNRFFFVSANGKKLMAAWFNLRKKRNTVNNSEDCIVEQLLRKVTQKTKDPRIKSMIGGILYPFVTNPHPCPKPLYLKSRLTPNVYLLALCGCCKAAPSKQQH